MFKGTKQDFERFLVALADLHKGSWKRAMTDTEVQEFEPFSQLALDVLHEESSDTYTPRRVIMTGYGDLKLIILKMDQILASSGKVKKMELRYEGFLFKGTGLWGHCPLPIQGIDADGTFLWNKCVFTPRVPAQNSKTATHAFQNTGAL